MLKNLWNDEAGVIISAEIVLVGTVLVLGMVAGLVELQCSVVGELNDLGDAIGNLDQSYYISGILAEKATGEYKGYSKGTTFNDGQDTCDCDTMILCDAGSSQGEKPSPPTP